MSSAIDYSEYHRLRGGMDDKLNAIEMPESKMQLVENMMVQQESLVKRSGYTTRFSGQLESGADILHVTQWENRQQERVLVYIVNGELYVDNGTTRTKLTRGTGVTLSTSSDSVWSTVVYDGSLIGTDGINKPWIVTSQTGTVELLADEDLPDRCSFVTKFKEHVFFANITDFDGNEYPYRLIHSEPTRETVYPGDTNKDFDATQEITGMAQHGDYLLIFQSRQTHFATLRRSEGNIQSNFEYHRLSPVIGCIGGNTIVTTESGAFWLDEKGVYYLPSGELSYPRYVSRPMEQWWSTIDKTRLYKSYGAELPNKNGIIWIVPSLNGNSENDLVLYLNYEVWSRESSGYHPALSYWTGTSDTPYTFRSIATVTESDETRGVVAGGYDGMVYTLDTGVTDNGEDIGCKVVTPYYSPGGRGVEKFWYRMGLDVDLNSSKVMSITVRLFNETGPESSSFTAGTNSDTLSETFVLGASQLGSDDLGRIVGDLMGRSRYIQLVIELSPDNKSFALHGILMYFMIGQPWA